MILSDTQVWLESGDTWFVGAGGVTHSAAAGTLQLSSVKPVSGSDSQVPAERQTIYKQVCNRTHRHNQPVNVQARERARAQMSTPPPGPFYMQSLCTGPLTFTDHGILQGEYTGYAWAWTSASGPFATSVRLYAATKHAVFSQTYVGGNACRHYAPLAGFLAGSFYRNNPGSNASLPLPSLHPSSWQSTTTDAHLAGPLSVVPPVLSHIAPLQLFPHHHPDERQPPTGAITAANLATAITP